MILCLSIYLIWSGVNPVDRFTWYLEVAPAVLAMIGAILALVFCSRFSDKSIEAVRAFQA